MDGATLPTGLGSLLGHGVIIFVVAMVIHRHIGTHRHSSKKKGPKLDKGTVIIILWEGVFVGGGGEGLASNHTTI